MCEGYETYYIARGYGSREVKTRCGNTKTDGSRAICEKCESNPRIMAEINRQEASIEADNAWSHSAGGGDW